MSEIRLGSLFDGIGVFPLAAVRCGIVPAWASEIEKAPISITKRHFPGMAHLGDVTKLNGGNIPPVHIITFCFYGKNNETNFVLYNVTDLRFKNGDYKILYGQNNSFVRLRAEYA